MDSDVSVFIITSDRQYIPFNEYDIMLDGEGIFVMVTNDRMNPEFGDDNSIFIHKNWKDETYKASERLSFLCDFHETHGYVSTMWQSENTEIPDTLKMSRNTILKGLEHDYDGKQTKEVMMEYLDGYRTNMEIMSNVVSVLDGRSLEGYIPAIITAYHTIVSFDGNMVHGYLPTIGQLLYMADSVDLINDAMRKMDYYPGILPSEKHILREQWWSSTEYDRYNAWQFCYGNAANSPKHTYIHLLPIFKI